MNPTNEHREQARADNQPPLQTLYAMFEEWRTSFPPERRPERDAPHTEQLIDAWIAGFAKHNEITCAAQLRSADARPAVAADARELVEQWREANDWPGLVWSAQNLSDEPRWLAAWQDIEQRITAYVNQRDAEIREVLEGLSLGTDCWCPVGQILDHTPACLAARTLYAKLQPKESSDVTD